MQELTVIDIHLQRSFLLLRRQVRCLRLILRSASLGHSPSPPWQGLGSGQDRNHEVNHFLPLDDDIRRLEHQNLVLGPLGHPFDLILEPLLNGHTFFDDRRLVLVVDVRLLVIGGGCLVERRPEFSDDMRTFFGVGPACDDGVTDDLERIEAVIWADLVASSASWSNVHSLAFSAAWTYRA